MAAVKCDRCGTVFDGDDYPPEACEACNKLFCPDCWEQEQFAAMESETLTDEDRNLCAQCWEAPA